MEDLLNDIEDDVVKEVVPREIEEEVLLSFVKSQLRFRNAR